MTRLFPAVAGVLLLLAVGGLLIAGAPRHDAAALLPTATSSTVKESLTVQVLTSNQQLPTATVQVPALVLPAGEWEVYGVAVWNPADHSQRAILPLAGISLTPTPPFTNTPRPTATATVAPVATATPTSSATQIPTLTPSQIGPVLTPTEAFTPTLEKTGTPATPITATPAPDVLECWAGISATTLNVRTGAGTSFQIMGQVHSPDRVQVVAVEFTDVFDTTGKLVRVDEWARIKFGPSTGFIAIHYNGAQNAIYDLSEDCSRVRFPPPPIVRGGLHLLFSAQSAPVLALVSSGKVGSLKGTTGAEWLVKAARQVNPGLLTVWRSLATALGWRDCPALWGVGDPRVTADQWFDAQLSDWRALGLIGVVDFFEYRNECGFQGIWEVAFDLQMVKRANAAGICLALFSDGYGNPQISEFVQRKPVLDAMLAHPCAPGRYHAISYHVYEGQAGGVWTAGRWRLFLAALGDVKYWDLPWLLTEYGYSDGRGGPDCGRFLSDWRAASDEYTKFDNLWGFEAYSVGGGTIWTDLTGCLAGL